MTWLVKTFHAWGIPYGIAIIMLTVIVRGCMFPISKKQALSAKRMKELQPQLTELRDKYKEDRQALAQAQMELYRKANFNPLAGCLPVFMQLPIFIGLYRALSNSVRSAHGSVSVVRQSGCAGQSDDDVLLAAIHRKLIQPAAADHNGTVLVPAKMFMPPATNPEMEMQQKMMSYMMIFFGFLFYHVPAGLCVYFIGVEWLGHGRTQAAGISAEKPQPENTKPRKEGWLARKMKELQEIAEMQQQLQQRQSLKDRESHPHDKSPHPLTRRK